MAYLFLFVKVRAEKVGQPGVSFLQSIRFQTLSEIGRSVKKKRKKGGEGRKNWEKMKNGKRGREEKKWVRKKEKREKKKGEKEKEGGKTHLKYFQFFLRVLYKFLFI